MKEGRPEEIMEFQPQNSEGSLSAILPVISLINRLGSREKDPGKLINRVCTYLVHKKFCLNAWIALLETDNELGHYAQAGLGPDFNKIIDAIRGGVKPLCMQEAQGRSDAFIVRYPEKTCGNCPLLDLHRNSEVVTLRIKKNGRIHGVFSVSLPRGGFEKRRKKDVIKGSDFKSLLESLQD